MGAGNALNDAIRHSWERPMKHKHEWEKTGNSTRCVICGEKKVNAVPNLRGSMRGLRKVVTV